jgi:hypothetical protein
MITLFKKIFLFPDHYAHKSVFANIFSKAPLGFSFWTFINVLFQKPKVELTFFYILRN